MISFKPIMVQDKESLDRIPKITGQYIVVLDDNEIYIDTPDGRKKNTQNIFTQSYAPEYATEGDLWIVTEE